MTPETHAQLANFIWSICNLLRGPYKRNEYRKVILPFTVLRRFDCMLAPTKERVLKEHAAIKAKPENVVRSLLEKITGRPFYNLSKLDLPKLLDDPNQLAPNLNSYINGFSKNYFVKMKKSLGNKRNKIGDTDDGEADQIQEIARIFGNFQDGETRTVKVNGQEKTLVVSKVFDNAEFGFNKITVERPLRLNFQVTPERIARLEEETAFRNIASSNKKNEAMRIQEIETRQAQAGGNPCSAERIRRTQRRNEPPRPLEEIEADIKVLEAEIMGLLKEVTA